MMKPLNLRATIGKSMGIFGTVFACALVACCGTASAQADSACPDGHRVVAHRWDAVLRVGWELRQDCAHPGWPARMVAIGSIAGAPPVSSGPVVVPSGPAPMVLPLLVHAGDRVRLWMQDQHVRIEMSGVAERSAHNGEHVSVRIARQMDDADSTVQSVAGIVRGAGDVEMER